MQDPVTIAQAWYLADCPEPTKLTTLRLWLACWLLNRGRS